MNPITVLPDCLISEGGPVAQAFRDRQITTFHHACQWIKDLPYGANSNSVNSLIVFVEHCGTCTTKHGLIARLAEELGLTVYKNLGFYRLNDDIVTGVNDLLAPYGLSFIPQIHCFLEYGEFRVDLTEGNCNGKNKTIDEYDFVVRVQPELTEDDEKQYYMQYLAEYFKQHPKLHSVGIPTLFDLLNACNQRVKYQCSVMAQSLSN